MILLLSLSILTAICITTVTRSTLFSYIHSYLENNYPKLYTLATCPYCFSHWLTAFIVLVFIEFLPVYGVGYFLAFFINWAIILFLSMIFTYVLILILEGM